jgi:hypothetical protein
MENIALTPAQRSHGTLYWREYVARKRALNDAALAGDAPAPVAPALPANAPALPSHCALYWREYNARKRAEDPEWDDKRRKLAALIGRRKYVAKMEALGRAPQPAEEGKAGRPRKY